MNMAENTGKSASGPGVSGAVFAYRVAHCAETLVERGGTWYCTLDDARHSGDHEAHVKLDNSDEPRRTWPSKLAPGERDDLYREIAQLRAELESAREMAEAWRMAKGHSGPIEADHPESMCHRCGGPNVEWSAPSPLWNQVMRGGSINGVEKWHGIICPTCFAVLAVEAGVVGRGNWRLWADQVLVPLETVTPSGRVWNEKTWMFDCPADCTTDCPHCEGRRDSASGARLEIAEIYSAGGVAPYQAEGRLSDGRDFYFRVRHSGGRLDAVGGHSVGVELTYPRGDPHVWSYVDPSDATALLTFLAHTLGSVEDFAARTGAVEWDSEPNTADWLAARREAGDQS